MKLKPVFLSCGVLLLALAAAMMPPLFLDLIAGNPDWHAFFMAAATTSFAGALLALSARDKVFDLSGREVFLAAVLGWVITALFAALPFMMSDLRLSPAQAFFESMSGITGTGFTVIDKLETQPHGILLWRALLQWIGGIATITALLTLPRLAQTSLSADARARDLSNIMPRAGQTAGLVLMVYTVLTLFCGILLSAAGMSAFDAAAHAMTAISGGGFSTTSAASPFKTPLIAGVIIPFMLLGALPFALYLRALRGDKSALSRDSRVRWFLASIAAVTALIAGGLVLNHGLPLGAALHHALFRTVAAATTTGFSLYDDALFGPFSVTLLIVLSLIGGCAGSVAGGLRVFRAQTLWSTAALHLRLLITPNALFQARAGGQPVDAGAQISALLFFSLWCCSLAVIVALLCMAGQNIVPGLSQAFAALTSAGPAVPGAAGGGSFSKESSGVLSILSLAMLLGRVEILAVLALFSPYFWRR